MTPQRFRLILAVLIATICIVSFGSTAAPARDEWESFAKKGDLKSMISLGVMYHTGDGVETNYQKAMDWYLQAYEKKDGDALNNIGVLFRDGLGVPKNEKIAYTLFLTVHMEGLGTEATQYRAGRNLSRLAGVLKQEEIHEVLSYTWQYVDQIVRSRGANTKIGNDVLPSKTRLRIRDFGWWLPEERKKMDFKSPPPWDMATPAPAAHEYKIPVKSTNAPVNKPK
jgi:TPR repeat protein